MIASHSGWLAVEPVLDNPGAERARLLDDLGHLAPALRDAALGRGGAGDGHITCRDTEKQDHVWLS